MFLTALSNVLLTLFYLVPGFILAKCNKAFADHLPTMSAILVYICAPFLVLSSFLQMEFSVEHIINMGIFFVASLVCQLLFVLLTFAVLHKKYDDIAYRMMSIGSICGNVGFFGMPIVTSLFPENTEVACYSVTYMLSMNVIVFSIGVFCMTGDRKYMSLKSAILNPTTIAFVACFILYLCRAGEWMPSLIVKGTSALGSMSTPLCMLVLGVRLAQTTVKELFTNWKAYVTSALKLIVFPLFCYALVYFIPIDQTLKYSLMVLSSVPCAAVMLSLAEMYHSGRKAASNYILICTLLSFITIPLLTLLIQ